MMEPAPFETGRPGIKSRWSQGHGLSESDIMSRQRYIENSRNPETVQEVVSWASNPGLPPAGCSSDVLHNFLQEQERIVSSFRAQPWPMQMKMAAVKSHKGNINKHTSQLKMADYCRTCVRKVARKFRLKLQALLEVMTLWRSIIKHIEGQSGTSVASFFVLLRWLCALNLFLALLILFVVIIPQAVFGHGLDVPPSVRENGTALSFLIDGKGYLLEYSVLFYGYYDSGQNEPYHAPPPNSQPFLSPLHYKLPLAYALLIPGIFLLYCIAILVKMAIKYRTLQKASVGERFPFSWLVFNSWDFAITKPATATSKMMDITISLKETLAEARPTEEPKQKIGLVFVRIFTNLLIFLTLAGTSYAIYLAVDNAEAKVHRRDFHEAFNSGTEGIVLFMASFQVQAVVTARNMVLPYVFRMAEWLEKFHPRTALKLRLVRLFLLYLSSLYVLIISLFTFSSQCGGGGGGVGGRGCCWENSIGQELFKLNLTHLLADLATMSLDVTRWLLPKIPHWDKMGKLTKMVGPTEFRLADSVLRLIYGQALVLLGVLFCPLLPIIGLVKYILIFYCRSVVVYYCNQPPHNIFRVSSTLNFYLGVLLATALLCSFPVGYAMIRISPSNTCGPFRGLENMLHVLLEEIDTWPQALQVAIDNMRTATVIVPVLALLGLQIYYYAVMSSALKEVNKDLKLQLRMEHADIREKMAQFQQTPPVGQRHLQLLQALHSQQNSDRRLSFRQNPMLAEPDTPHHRHTSHHHHTPPHTHQHPSHPHTNGLMEDQTHQQQTPVVKPPPVLASSHTHH